MKKEVWDQLKNKTAKQLMNALEKDGWVRQVKRGAIQSFLNPENKKVVTIHYHPKKTYGAKLLKDLISQIGWTEEDLKRLKLIR